MTLRQALTLARDTLAARKDGENPSFESEVLLRYALQISRAQLYLDLDKALNPEKEKVFRQWIERRLQGEPVAYIIGHREFFGLDFYVDNRVLVPRPESELLVEEAIKLVKEGKIPLNLPRIKYGAGSLTKGEELMIADIGTGSGAVAVSLAVNLAQVRIYATDISTSALEVAAINCQKHDVADRITLLQGDMLDPLPGRVDIIIANLPYVQKVDLAQMPSAKYEPALALDGGESGLDKIFRLCRQLEGKVRPGGCVLLEIGMGQGREVIDLLSDLFPSASTEILPDLAGIERVVKMVL